MSSPMVRTAPLLRALLVCAGLVQVAAALERNGRPGSPFAPAGAAGARNLLGPAAHAVGCHLPPLLGLRRIATPVELDWEGGEVRVAGESARVFGSIPRLSFRNANTESGATFPGRGDTDLDDWFPRANDDPLDADLTLVAMPLAGPLLGISNVRVRGEYGNRSLVV